MKEKNRGVSPQLNSSSNSQVTQPVGDARNVRRNQQIKALHLQFQDLKKKIKDVESKNQKIIQNIHKQYDFKKKPTNSQYSIQPTPVVHYQQRNQQSHITITDNNQSDNSDGEQRPRQITKKINVKKNNQPSFHQSIEYRKTQNYAEERDQSQIGSKTNTNAFYKPPMPAMTPYQYSAGSQFAISPIQPQQQFQISQFNGLNSYQMPMQFPSNYNGGMSISQANSSFYGQNNIQIDQMLKREREKIKVLESELEQRQNEIAGLRKVQKKYNALSNNYNQSVELCLQQFFSQVVEKGFYEMEKHIKKNQNKLKKMQIKLKDHQEHERSQKNILQHRSKRSSSRSKKQASPTQNYNSITSVPRVPSAKKGRDSIPNDSTSKSKQSESKSSQQFEQIATQYQEIIKIKTKEVEAYQVRFRQKEKQLIEMTAKCAKLEMKIADISNSASKSRRISSDQNLLTGSDFGSSNQKQVISLNKKINELQQALQRNQKQLSSKESIVQKNGKKLAEYQNKIKKNELQISKLKEQYKRVQKQKKTQTSTSSLISKLQSDLNLKEREFNILREKSIKLQNQKIQKECQNITLGNKIKKIESHLALKEQKICELEKIIQSSVGGEGGDLLEKSMYLQKMDQNDLHSLQQQKQKLEEQLIKQRQEIFIITKNNESLHSQLIIQEQNNHTLKKQIENLLIENESMRINIRAQSFQKYDSTPLKTLLQEGDAVSEDQEDQHLIKNQLEQLKAKHEETQKALKLQNQKTFQENRKVLKLTSQVKYFKEQLGQREDKYQKLRKQFEEMKYQINSLTHTLHQKQSELEVERKVNAQKIKQIESQWLQFQQDVRNNNLDTSQDNQHNELKSSRHFSEESFVNYRNTYNNINAENEKLMEKLKQFEKIVEVQKEMEDKIVSQYRSNVEKIKAELREKNKQQERLIDQNGSFKRRIRLLQQNQARLKQLAKGDEEQNLLGNSTQKVIELQMELNEMRQINNKLQAMEHQLFNQISQKQKELQGLLNALNAKDKRIEELEDIIQLKQINFSSHISTSQHKSKVRQSLQSQSSLRYSMLSNNNRDKTMELQLSEAGESFFDHNQSMISNVSEVFGREEFPYQKMQLKRVEQRRLFEKTAAYIKSLKHSIDEKNKRIKLLQRKIESLRNSELIRKDIYQIQQSNFNDLELDNNEIFKDYYSVQLQSQHSQRHKLKQLQHEAKLTIEQNNLLNNQIESMQEELLKAEEQENSLMKLKDLYKDEIKNLIKQNQDQIKLFEDQIKKERQKVQQSQSIQKMQAIKQIFLKIIQTFVSIEAEIGKPKKKEQKKKELQDYLKVCCNLMSLQSSIRQQLTASIREMKR